MPPPPELRDEIREQIQEQGLWCWMRKTLVTGLFVAAPLVLTWWLISSVVMWMDGLLIGILPESLQFRVAGIPGLGLLGGAVLLLAVGVLAKHYLGKKVLEWADEALSDIPVVRSVYGAVKKIVEALGGEGTGAFREVVLVQFPHQGSYAIAFLTGVTEGEVQEKTKARVLNAFVPTTPNPTSGFLIFVKESDIIRLDMTVDEGIKMVMSGGIVTPGSAKKKKK
ncbi:MAG: DUF502 domain-containing protein [Pseudomonadaceae bacterium]|nr:DUF502 domain-containing protein [Pseudomonadaceae bacterium]